MPPKKKRKSTQPKAPLKGHLDLHGYSEEQAKNVVLEEVRRVNPEQGSLRIVTGRGNHVNAQGQRGTLYQQLPEWLASSIEKAAELNNAEATNFLKGFSAHKHKASSKQYKKEELSSPPVYLQLLPPPQSWNNNNNQPASDFREGKKFG